MRTQPLAHTCEQLAGEAGFHRSARHQWIRANISPVNDQLHMEWFFQPFQEETKQHNFPLQVNGKTGGKQTVQNVSCCHLRRNKGIVCSSVITQNCYCTLERGHYNWQLIFAGLQMTNSQWKQGCLKRKGVISQILGTKDSKIGSWDFDLNGKLFHVADSLAIWQQSYFLFITPAKVGHEITLLNRRYLPTLACFYDTGRHSDSMLGGFSGALWHLPTKSLITMTLQIHLQFSASAVSSTWSADVIT